MIKSLDIKRLVLLRMVRNFPIRSFADDLADAIANPSPSRPFRDAAGRAGRDVCDALSNVPAWARTVPGAVRDLAGICAPYWDDEGIDPPTATPPFLGGQCPDNYTVSVLINGNLLGVGGESPKTIVGPLGGVTRTAEQVSGGPFPEFTVVWAFSNDPVNKRVTVRLNQGQLDASTISVVPQSGNPDDCGDPPPELQPGPNPSPRNPVIPPELQPTDDPERGPQLPIPGLPSLPGLPDIPFRNPFADRPAVDPTDPGEPGSPEDTGDGAGGEGGGEAEGEAPEGTELVGLRVDFSRPPLKPREYADGVFRAVGYVYMGGPEGLDQDPAGASLRSGQFVYAERTGLTRWRVAANIGFYLTVTPFYVERE